MEMQNDSKSDDVRKRSRFYQGLIDVPILKSGKSTKYKQLPSTVIIFITQDDIFGRDLAKYTFTEQCQEIEDLKLDDGTTKIFLNMTSKNGTPELVSMLQYMKDTNIDNPEIIMKDSRILELDEIVSEVRESEEWEVVRMNILEIGKEIGKEIEKERGVKSVVELCKEFGVSKEETIIKVIDKFEIDLEEAEKYLEKFWLDEGM